MKSIYLALAILFCVLFPRATTAAEESYAVLNIESDKVSKKDLASLTDYLTTEVKNAVPAGTRIYSFVLTTS
jgi:hypothetical protein